MVVIQSKIARIISFDCIIHARVKCYCLGQLVLSINYHIYSIVYFCIGYMSLRDCSTLLFSLIFFVALI